MISIEDSLSKDRKIAHVLENLKIQNPSMHSFTILQEHSIFVITMWTIGGSNRDTLIVVHALKGVEIKIGDQR